MKPFVVPIACLALVLLSRCVSVQDPLPSAHGVGNDLPRPYSTQRDWGALPPGTDSWAAVTAVEPSPDEQHIYVVHRCFENSCEGRSEPPVLKFNYDGDLVAAFGQGLFVFPHGATVDYEGNLWVTDAGSNDELGHRVIKFSPDGEVLMTIGEAGTGEIAGQHLFWPNDVVVDPDDGAIFIAESHRGGRNNRIMHFDQRGNHVQSWGSSGSAPGQLKEPHTIAMDSRGRLFVGDRENNRIQIFTRDGTLLEVWHQFGRPSGIYITDDDTIYVADSESGPDTGAGELPGIMKGIRVGSAHTGEVTAFIEDLEPLTDPHSGAEGVGVDHDGNVYGAVVRRRMLERHVLTD
jgi:DNA-binding beta-propeller fold protein YncE